jgi:hypothetical protein
MAKVKVPRRKYIGQRIDPRTRKPIEVQERDHFYRCKDAVPGSIVATWEWSSIMRDRCLIRWEIRRATSPPRRHKSDQTVEATMGRRRLDAL